MCFGERVTHRRNRCRVACEESFFSFFSQYFARFMSPPLYKEEERRQNAYFIFLEA
jgi:hypothetical protein